MKNEFKIHITKDVVEINGNTTEILISGLARLVYELKQHGVANEELIKDTVNAGLKYKEK